MFRKVSQELTQTKPGTHKRRNALASIENITREHNQHLYRVKSFDLDIDCFSEDQIIIFAREKYDIGFL